VRRETVAQRVRRRAAIQACLEDVFIEHSGDTSDRKSAAVPIHEQRPLTGTPILRFANSLGQVTLQRLYRVTPNRSQSLLLPLAANTNRS
jgi:hypothetical protein